MVLIACWIVEYVPGTFKSCPPVVQEAADAAPRRAPRSPAASVNAVSARFILLIAPAEAEHVVAHRVVVSEELLELHVRRAAAVLKVEDHVEVLSHRIGQARGEHPIVGADARPGLVRAVGILRRAIGIA